MNEACAAPEPDLEKRLRKLAFHEAAHAVMFWNAGFGVERVWVDRIRDCGHALPARQGKDRAGRVGYAVACIAGLAVQCYLEPTLLSGDVVRSYPDFRIALVEFLPVGALSDGEQLGVALALTRKVGAFLRGPEVKRQVYALVPSLLRHGCLLRQQVESLLQALPESRTARQKTRELIEELVREREQIVASARGYAPEFRWNADIPGR